MTEVGGAVGFVPGGSGVRGQGQGSRDWVHGSPSCRAVQPLFLVQPLPPLPCWLRQPRP